MNFNLKKTLKKSLRRITKSDFVINLISSAIYWYARLVGKTTSWEVRGIDNFYREWDDNRGIILVAWHGRALMLPYFWNRKKPLNALVSLHRDGRMIAGLLEKFGLGTIGGSSNENASGAAVKLMHSLKDDTAICIIPDGPGTPDAYGTLSSLLCAKNRKTYRLYFVQHRQLFPHNKILGPHDDSPPVFPRHLHRERSDVRSRRRRQQRIGNLPPPSGRAA